LAKPVILEPIMNMEITTPGKFHRRRDGRSFLPAWPSAGMDSRGKNTVIRAQVPLAEVLRYEPDLRSMTSGREISPWNSAIMKKCRAT
jgi:elongation factor G